MLRVRAQFDSQDEYQLMCLVDFFQEYDPPESAKPSYERQLLVTANGESLMYTLTGVMETFELTDTELNAVADMRIAHKLELRDKTLIVERRR